METWKLVLILAAVFVVVVCCLLCGVYHGRCVQKCCQWCATATENCYCCCSEKPSTEQRDAEMDANATQHATEAKRWDQRAQLVAQREANRVSTQRAMDTKAAHDVKRALFQPVAP
jgi:hypothetical protein